MELIFEDTLSAGNSLQAEFVTKKTNIRKAILKIKDDLTFIISPRSAINWQYYLYVR